MCHTLETSQNVWGENVFSLGLTSRLLRIRGQFALWDSLTLSLPDGPRRCFKGNISVVLGIRNVGSCQEEVLVLLGRKYGERTPIRIGKDTSLFQT